MVPADIVPRYMISAEQQAIMTAEAVSEIGPGQLPSRLRCKTCVPVLTHFFIWISKVQRGTMRFGNTSKVLAKRVFKYYIIPQCEALRGLR